MKFTKIWVFAALLLAPLAQADSWSLPEVEKYLSADGNWRLTVVPRELTSQLAYFQDKVDGRGNAGSAAAAPQASAVGQMEHREDGKWRTVWQRPLLNDVAPVEAIAVNGGRAVTLDNWHGKGYGAEAVAIYDEKGALVRAMALRDFLPEVYIKALSHSVSSINWRGSARVDGQTLVIPVIQPTMARQFGEERKRPRHVDIRFELATGERVAYPEPEWSGALAAALTVAKQMDEAAAVQRARFIAPLAVPTTSDELPWYQYLAEAYFRLGGDSYPAQKVIRLPSAKNYLASVKNLRMALEDDYGELMIASPSQDVLVDVLSREAAKVKPGSLAKVRTYVVVDADHVAAVRAALAPLEAQFIQIDPAGKIPQNKERLERFLKAE